MEETKLKILQELKDSLKYDKEEGKFYWKKRYSNRIHIEDVAGSYSNRYASLTVKGYKFLIHKLVWYFENDLYPDDSQIDHIDQDTHNNRIDNLRIVTAKENSMNKPKRRDNTSGITGVSFDKQTNKWVVRIKNHEGKYENRGRFTSIDEAKQARDRALIELGYSENHGKEFSKLPYRSE